MGSGYQSRFSLHSIDDSHEMGHRQVGILAGHNYLVAAGIVSLAAIRMINPESSFTSGLVIIFVYAGVNIFFSYLDIKFPSQGLKTQVTALYFDAHTQDIPAVAPCPGGYGPFCEVLSWISTHFQREKFLRFETLFLKRRRNWKNQWRMC